MIVSESGLVVSSSSVKAASCFPSKLKPWNFFPHLSLVSVPDSPRNFCLLFHRRAFRKQVHRNSEGPLICSQKSNVEWMSNHIQFQKEIWGLLVVFSEEITIFTVTGFTWRYLKYFFLLKHGNAARSARLLESVTWRIGSLLQSHPDEE